MESIEKIVIDTNVILRFLLNDDKEQAELASQIIANANCIVPIEVVAESVFVLSKVYFHDRKTVCNEIKDFAKIRKSLLLEKDVVCHACDVYASSTMDFVDCLIDGYAKIKGYKAFTFDKKLKKALRSNSEMLKNSR
jgi:predicted nucleic-acid-binding protein